jgi:transcriptional regulator with AAA-type ATPase domain/transcriptional regulatory protein LevR
VQRKDRVYAALQSLCAQRPTQQSVLRRDAGFSAEEVAEVADIDRTNASRDLNKLAQEGVIERIPGRPVLFTLKNNHNPEALNHHSKSATARANDDIATPVSGPLKPLVPASAPILPDSAQISTPVTSLETLIGSDEGIKTAIQQAKAAIIYPPRGLHTLIVGPSGVGKTTLARLMHAFALELKALPANAPFVSFNCADYAGNPQLLMANLFGVVRGAYTGAERDREGLVEQADRGILFLDEVHRLPPEGQEMLFYLMDRERFRRLGDSKERHASLLLLAATTEDPNVALLPTFRRRIPMTINLPGLKERTIKERYELIRTFFATECSSIGVNIHVAPQVLRALLLYECPGNIGQLRSDIQRTCARAYLEYRTHNLSEMHVHLDVLSEHVRSGLLRTVELHRMLDPVAGQLETTHMFTPTGLNLNSLSGSAHDLYDSISTELAALRNSGLSTDEINNLLYLDIQNYFQHFADTITQEYRDTNLELVDVHITETCHAIVQFAEAQLDRIFPDKMSLVLALHLTSALERTAQHRPLVEPSIPSMRYTYPREYAIAQAALLRIHSDLGVMLPENEADVLTILLANADILLSNEHALVGIVVAAHGRGIASGLADLVTTLIGVNTVTAVELSLEQTPEELLTRVEQGVRRVDQGSGVLLLVDFASLLSLADLISQRTGIQTRAVSGVCAPLLVEAVRKAQRAEHITLDQLATSLAHFYTTEGQHTTSLRPMERIRTGDATTAGADGTPAQGRVILSVCLTGFGSAMKLAELIEDRLPGLPAQGVEITCMDINLSGKTEADIQRLVGNQQIVAIVGTINPHLEHYPFISLTEILFGDGIARLRTLLGDTLIDPAFLQPAATLPGNMDNETPTFTQRTDLIREISHTLSKRMLFLNPTRILPLIERMIEMIEIEVGETFEIEVLAGLILHLACVLERSQQEQKGFQVSKYVRDCVEQQFARELSICRRAWQILSTQIARPLPDEEAYNIVGILRQVDIFLLNTP